MDRNTTSTTDTDKKTTKRQPVRQPSVLKGFSEKIANSVRGPLAESDFDRQVRQGTQNFHRREEVEVLRRIHHSLVPGGEE